jgi:tight adherence protein C
MDIVPLPLFVLFAAGAFVVALLGLRGVLALRAALRDAEPWRLAAPEHWQFVRALAGLLPALPMLALAPRLGLAALAGAGVAAAAGYTLAPLGLEALRQRARRELLDELTLHLDLIALAMESGSSWGAALAICAERAPDGPLRRAWQRAVLDMQAGAEPLDVLRDLDLKLRLPSFSTLVATLRSVERVGVDGAALVRDRARQAAAARFARAERRARAAPLRLFATLVLCLLPCTPLLLAFPLARGLVQLFGR